MPLPFRQPIWFLPLLSSMHQHRRILCCPTIHLSMIVFRHLFSRGINASLTSLDYPSLFYPFCAYHPLPFPPSILLLSTQPCCSLRISRSGLELTDAESRAIIRGASEEDLAHSGLEDTMINSFAQVGARDARGRGMEGLQLAIM